MSKTDRPKFARNKFAHEEKDRKRSEAKVRQELYNALTIEQKIAKLGDRPAVKQRMKLAAQAMEQALASKKTVTEVSAEVVAEVTKEKKGQKAKRQNRKDKKANA